MLRGREYSVISKPTWRRQGSIQEHFASKSLGEDKDQIQEHLCSAKLVPSYSSTQSSEPTIHPNQIIKMVAAMCFYFFNIQTFMKLSETVWPPSSSSSLKTNSALKTWLIKRTRGTLHWGPRSLWSSINMRTTSTLSREGRERARRVEEGRIST